MKTLVFEGAGMNIGLSDINNCRLRTRIENKEGRIIYLELGGLKPYEYTPNYLKMFNVFTHIDHLFYEDILIEARNNHSPELDFLTKQSFEYNKKNIINFVNYNLNCDFEEMIVLDEINVHNTKEPLCSCK